MKTINTMFGVLPAAALAVAAAFAAQAQTPTPKPPPPQLTAAAASGQGVAAVGAAVEATVTVVAVDSANRTVTVKRANGKVSTIEVGDQVKNFDQIKVGDHVHAKYTQALALELKNGGASPAPPTEEHAITPAPGAGQKPGGVVARKVTVTAVVTAVDKTHKLVTLRGPEGQSMDVEVDDADQLNSVKKGDHVQATYLEAVAISVVPAKHAAAAPAK